MKATSSAERILSKRKKIIFNVALIFALLILSLSSYFIIEGVKEKGAAVTVTINGELIAEYPLNVNGEYPLNGGTNILVIENGYAYMKYADCPKQLCVNTGKINRTLENIECLHHNITVRVIGNGDEIIPN